MDVEYNNKARQKQYKVCWAKNDAGQLATIARQKTECGTY